MRAVVQRVSSARVIVDGRATGEIAHGLLVYLGVGAQDDDAAVRYTVEKVVGLRIFADAEQKMNLAVADVGGALLVVSQFTLYGDVRRGRRPAFDQAMEPTRAEARYHAFVERARALGVRVETGEFRAHMAVHSVVDGPVTILIDSTRQF